MLEGKIGDQERPALQSSTSNTLDEPVSDTILRDLKAIGTKIKYVLLPYDTQGLKELRNWDLWGPLILCIVLASSLSASAANNQMSLMFATVFVIVWCGAGIVTLNAALLGGVISFFQSVCVLGYCICPINIASLVALAWNNRYFKLVVSGISFFWATRASVGFMAQHVPSDRRLLAVYPVILFYLVLTWLVISQ